MDKFFTGLWKAITSYWSNTQLADWQFWTYILGALLLTWLIAVLLNKFLIKPQGNDELKKVFFIHRSWIVSAFIVAGSIIGLMCFWWAKNKYSRNHLEFSHLIALILVLTVPIISAIRLRSLFSHQDLKEITPQAISNEEENRLTLIARKGFFKNRLSILIGALGFLGLLMLLYRPVVMVSIVIDDSGSMGQSLKIGTDALTQTFSKFDPKYTQVVITSFGKSNPQANTPYPNFSSLSKVTDVGKLDANTIVCASLDDATNYVAGLQPDKGLGLNQAVWQNFLHTKTKYNEDSTIYGDKVLLIITDGLEYNRQWYNKTLCDPSTGLSGFYEDNIHWIDLLDRNSLTDTQFDGFNQMMKECYANNIYPGLDLENYMGALSSVLNDFELDWRLIYWMIFFFVLLSLIFFLIEPQKIV